MSERNDKIKYIEDRLNVLEDGIKELCREKSQLKSLINDILVGCKRDE